MTRHPPVPAHTQEQLKVVIPNLTKMESWCKEAIACVQGEEKARSLLESIRLQTDDSDWLNYATGLSQQATIDFQTRAVEVDGQIEAMASGFASSSPPSSFTLICQSLVTLEAMELAIGSSWWWSFDKFPQLIEACEEGDVGVVCLCIQAGTDPSANNNAAISTASENGHYGVVDRLLQDPRVNPSALDQFAIRLASENGHYAVVDRLLQLSLIHI